MTRRDWAIVLLAASVAWLSFAALVFAIMLLRG